MYRLRKSLLSKLSTGITLMAIPIFVLSLGALFLQSRYFIRQEASDHARSLLDATMHRIKKYMLTTEMATNANTWFIEHNFQPDSLLVLSRRIVMLNGNTNSCTISAAPDIFPQCGRYFSVYSVRRGDTIASIREQNYEYVDRQWYKTPVAQGDGCWVEPVFEHTEGEVRTDETVLSYCKPLYDRNQTGPDGKKRLLGVVCVDLSFPILTEAINAGEPEYPGSYYIMLGGNGHYFYHPDSKRLLRKTYASDIDPKAHADILAIGHEMVTGKEGHMHAQINGEKCHVVYRSLPSSKWSIALVSPDSEILHSYNQLTYIIIALIVIGLAIILWLCRRAVGHAVRPVSYLVGMSKQISEGHYDLEIPRTSREDAIGQLQNSFATMQQSIEERISSIQQASEETKRRNEELVTAMQMAKEGVRQKNIFIQNVSHQIRTPLNIILGFAQILRESQDMDEKELQEIRSMMNYNAFHLYRMVSMLFASSDTGASKAWKSQLTDQLFCNELARDSVRYIQDHFPGIEVHLESEVPDSLQIVTNHLYLMRPLRELLYNAAKYSDGQHITLRIEQTEASVRFTVEDVGPGLSAESIDKLFKPFNKLDDLSEGLGLGLPLARSHILSLGGILEYDDTYLEGCRFIVTMPK